MDNQRKKFFVAVLYPPVAVEAIDWNKLMEPGHSGCSNHDNDGYYRYVDYYRCNITDIGLHYYMIRSSTSNQQQRHCAITQYHNSHLKPGKSWLHLFARQFGSYREESNL